MRVALRYENIQEQLKTTVDKGFETELNELIQKSEEEKKLNSDSKATELLALLVGITFLKSRKKRPKVDALSTKPTSSNPLKIKSESGRVLSVNQINALKKMVIKYKNQITDFEAKAAELKLKVPEEAPQDPEEIKLIESYLRPLALSRNGTLLLSVAV